MSPAGHHGIASFYDLLFEPVNRRLALAGLRSTPVRAGMHVLDICCGTGSQLSVYQRLGCDVFGLDASAAMLDVARRRLGERANLELGDATQLPYASGAFDLVTCKFALHEMPEETRCGVLAEAARVVRSEGRILLTDFHIGPYRALDGWISRLVVVAVEFMAGGEHFRNHRQLLGAGGLPALGARAGLRVERLQILSGGTFAVACLSRGTDGLRQAVSSTILTE